MRFANRAYAEAKVRFEFAPTDAYCTRVRSTLLNNMVGGSAPNWGDVKRAANDLAAKHAGRLVVLFCHGPGPIGTGASFAGTDINFIVTAGWDDARHCDHPHVDALAHEIGHHFGLAHTFAGEPFDTVGDAEALLRAKSGDPAAFDGDGLEDTPPDACIRALECRREAFVMLDGRRFDLPRRNIMSYYDERDALSPQQIERLRWVLAKRLEGGMALPTHRGVRTPIEAEMLEIVEAGRCGKTRQEMSMFGLGDWSGEAQLFAGAERGGWVTVKLPVSRGGRYRLVLYATCARDFGRIQARLDGRWLGPVFDGYAPIVMPSGPVRLGVLDLQAGDHLLRFNVVGKNPLSKGHSFGIDCVELVAIP